MPVKVLSVHMQRLTEILKNVSILEYLGIIRVDI